MLWLDNISAQTMQNGFGQFLSPMNKKAHISSIHQNIFSSLLECSCFEFFNNVNFNMNRPISCCSLYTNRPELVAAESTSWNSTALFKFQFSTIYHFRTLNDTNRNSLKTIHISKILQIKRSQKTIHAKLINILFTSCPMNMKIIDCF